MTITTLACESSSQRFAGRGQRPAPRKSAEFPAMRTSYHFSSGGILPKFAEREVAPMTVDITTHGAFARPLEFITTNDGDFPPLKPQGLLEGFNHAKVETERAVELYKTYQSAKQKLAYDESSMEDITQNLIARVEDLVSLFVLIRNVNSVHGLLAAVHLYVRTHYRAPIVPLIWSHVKPVIDKLVAAAAKLGGFQPQAGYENEPDKTESIIHSIKDALKDWRKHREGVFGKSLGNLVSVLVTFGCFPDFEENPFLCSFLRTFKVKAWNVQKNTLEFTDMFMDTMVFFLERGYAAYKLGDMSPLLFEDEEASNMEKEYSLLISALPLLDAGKLSALESLGEGIVDATDYEVRLENLIGKVHDLLKVADKKGLASQLSAKLVNLKKLRTALILAQKTSSIREKPFTLMIYGASSVGKSEIMAKLMKILLSANGLPSSKEYICTLNDGDKYSSEYKAYKNAVIIDDFGNTKAEHYEGSPVAPIIKYANNVPTAVLKADVESKGGVYFLSKFLGITTNVKDLMAHIFSNEPVSVLRRFDFILDVVLRPDYVHEETGGLNGKKMIKFLEDAWCINLQIVKIIRADPNKTGKDKQKDSYKFVDVLKHASLEEVAEYLTAASIEHFADQKRFVQNVEEAYDIDLCKHFRHPKECAKCEAEHADDPDKQHVCEEMDPQGGDDSDDDAEIMSEISDSTNMDTYKEHVPLKELVKRWYDDHAPKVDIEPIKGKLQTFKEMFDEHKDSILGGLLIGGIALTSVIAALKIYRSFSKIGKVFEQGDAQSLEVVPGTNYVPNEKENPWKNVKRTSVPSTRFSKTTPFAQFRNTVSCGVHRCRIHWPTGERKICMMFPLKGSAWVLPTHMLPKDDVEYIIEGIKSDNTFLTNVIKDRVSSKDFVRLPGDMTLVNLVSGGPVRDFSKFLVDGEIKNGERISASLLDLNKELEFKVTDVYVGNFRHISTTSTKFFGCDYKLPYETYNGLCGAPLVTYGSQLLGFHLAGNGFTGAAGTLSLKDFNEAYQELSRKRLVASSTGVMNTAQFGKDFTPSGEIPQRHAVKFMRTHEDGHEPSLQVYGAHSLGVPSFNSDVHTSPISKDVEEIMELPREHGRPNRQKIWRHWQRDLDSIAHTRGDFQAIAWDRSCEDLQGLFDSVMDSHPEQMRFSPLNWLHTINGINGVKWIDRINTKSSMGFPINKSKNDFLEPIMEDVPGVCDPIDFSDPSIRQSYEEAIVTYREGERIYAVHRGNLKDEPTKFTKDKIRVFAGSQIVFTLLVRTYYLPVVKFIQDNGLELECAVGINAFGPEWEDVTKRITQFGEDRMIAGDYKAFDKTASAKAMMSAFQIMIHVAARAGYSEDDLCIMQGIATDICYPLYEFAGVLLQAFGSNPSGHPLTVVVNNLMNSLYLRYAYFCMHPEVVPPFASVVKALCYGDDNVMNVSPKEKLFNHTTVAEELRKAGITYTMADKTSESIPLIHLKDINFLKRGFRYEPALKRHVAPIEEASISKMLHNIRGTGVPDLEIAKSALFTANREFFLHGEEIFSYRRNQLIKVGRNHFGPDYTLPDWNLLVDEFLEDDGQVKVLSSVPVDMIPEPLELSPQSGNELPAFVSIPPASSRSSSELSGAGMREYENENDLLWYTDSLIENAAFMRNDKVAGGLGEIDLAYMNPYCIVNIECKLLKTRSGTQASRYGQVLFQASKYGKILHLLRPELVTFSFVMTEYGLELVKVRGPFTTEAKLAAFHIVRGLTTQATFERQLVRTRF